MIVYKIVPLRWGPSTFAGRYRLDLMIGVAGYVVVWRKKGETLFVVPLYIRQVLREIPIEELDEY